MSPSARRVAPGVAEAANAGEHHREAEAVGGGDDVGVIHRAAGLDQRGDAVRSVGEDLGGGRLASRLIAERDAFKMRRLAER